ncbi:hypothetical protein F4Z99_09050 [Candidatus Poribacteria bacterium]|nr:hypothetical protein [Candidatus Poribacteria bacterium]MYA99498.1 hypothetical protein [Candidatus Poribacteria bacterium]
MFLRTYWVPITIFIAVLMSCSLILLQPRERPPIKIYKTTEIETQTAKPPPPGADPNGHWHGDEWHAAPHEADTGDETPRSQPRPLPETALEGHLSPEEAYQALREKYPDRTNNPHPFENVPVDLYDFEATKAAFMDHFNFYVAQGGNKPEVFENNREVRIAYAVMTNISNAAQPWVGLFTREQREEIKELRRRYREFQGVNVNHDRVWQLVKDEGYSVSEALDISREEDSNR